jgi:hypothetical protein
MLAVDTAMLAVDTSVTLTVQLSEALRRLAKLRLEIASSTSDTFAVDAR